MLSSYLYELNLVYKDIQSGFDSEQSIADLAEYYGYSVVVVKRDLESLHERGGIPS